MDALISRQQALLDAMNTATADAEAAICRALDEVEEQICDRLADEVEAGKRSATAAERLLEKLGIAY